MKQPAYIFDIDGTLSNPGHRLRFITGYKKDWDSFYGELEHDEPICDVVGLALTIAVHTGHAIILITGRPERTRQATIKWLDEHTGLWPCKLYMRPDGDRRPDYELKHDIYEREIKDKYDVAGVFEDRQQVVDMWRSLGLTCFQVANGNH